MRKLKIIITLATLLLSPCLALGNDVGKMLDEIPTDGSYDINLLLPIHVPKKISLSVNIPKNFKKLSDPSGLMEFTPKADKDPKQWSQMITVVPFIGSKLSAKQLLENFVSLIGKQNKSVKILDGSYNNKDDIGMANAVMSYTEQGREELLEVYAFSGPYDSVIVQNAVPVKPYGTIEKAKEKLNEFFDKNLSMVDGNKAIE